MLCTLETLISYYIICPHNSFKHLIKFLEYTRNNRFIRHFDEWNLKFFKIQHTIIISIHLPEIIKNIKKHHHLPVLFNELHIRFVIDFCCEGLKM